jgi:ATPase family AAA domain-containing protein 3A/B
MVYFEKPSVKERSIILYHYLLKYCMPPSKFADKFKQWKSNPSSLFTKKKVINISSLSQELIEQIAVKTEGFSGRELTKLVISWHDAAFAKSDPILDKELTEEVLQRHIEQNGTKNKWNKSQDDYFKKMHKL